MTDQTPILPASKEPRLHGVVDVLRPDRLAGWVIDRTDPAQSVSVEVRREGRIIATVAASRPRKDLERQAVGTGCYGFALALDPPLDDGMEFTIEVTARSHDGVELTLQPVGSAARALSAEQRVLGRLLSRIEGLRGDIDSLRQQLAAAEAGRQNAQDRLELVQLRLEKEILAVDPPRTGAPGWLAAVATAGAILGFGSVVMGVLSL